MEEEVGLFGLDGTTVSLICGLSVFFVVLVIITLGIIGFFIKVRFINLRVYRSTIGKYQRRSNFVPEFYSDILQTFKARREATEKNSGTRETSIAEEEPTSECPQGHGLVGWLVKEAFTQKTDFFNILS